MLKPLSQITMLGFITVYLTGCATTQGLPPVNVQNVCYAYKQNPQWYDASLNTERRWDLPPPVLMAIINQESGFSATARPPRKKVLGILPIGKHISTAYGYSQALNQTWRHYEVANNIDHARRETFDDATDFIGWYTTMARKKLGIAKDDAYNLYLAYHEGLGGFARQSYQQKPWLMRVAARVSTRALLYKAQLEKCQHEIV